MILKKYKIFGNVVLSLLLVLFVAGCAFKPRSIGMHEEIIVFADEDDWNNSGLVIKEAIERTVKTPQPEKIFRLYRSPLDQFKLNKKHRNIIVMGTLRSDGLIGDWIKNNISEEVRRRVESGQNYLFTRKDEWAKNQIVMILIAPNSVDLNTKISENKDILFSLMDEENNRTLHQVMYKKAERKDLTKQLYDKYGFAIRVQHDYFLARDDAVEKVLWLRRKNPDRMVFVHWIDTTDVRVIPEEWVINKRNELSRKFMDGTEIIQDYTEVDLAEFKDYLAIETKGGWWQPEKLIGGPMRNYTFYDEKTSRIYMIDLSLIAPEFVGEKQPFLRQLHVIANTFTTDEPYSSK